MWDVRKRGGTEILGDGVGESRWLYGGVGEIHVIEMKWECERRQQANGVGEISKNTCVLSSRPTASTVNRDLMQEDSHAL